MIAFLFSPIGKMIAGGLLILAVATGIYAKGHRDGTERVEARVAREVAAERERQRAASDAVLSAAKRQAEASAAENAGNEQRVTELEAELALREAGAGTPAAGCVCSSNPRLSPNDGGKLDAIR